MKTFGGTRAVDGVDLAVPTGTVYGVLGPNSAGLTTTVKMLATLLRPDGGQAHVFGHDVVRVEPDPVALTARLGAAAQDTAAGEAAQALGEPARAGVTVDNSATRTAAMSSRCVAMTIRPAPPRLGPPQHVTARRVPEDAPVALGRRRVDHLGGFT